MARRSYSGNAKPTTLNGGISAAATSIAVADGTGYPTGATGPFVVTIAAGTAAEEKVLVASRTGNTLTVDSRGWDGTTASDHDNAVAVAHTFSATDADEMNAFINGGAGAAFTAKGQAGILASQQYRPGAQTKLVTSNTAFVDVDTTNLTVTFTAPASGAVIVRLSAYAIKDVGTASQSLFWAVRNGAGGTEVADGVVFKTASTSEARRTAFEAKVTGLTAGASYTYVWAQRVDGDTAGLLVGGTAGPALMEVEAA